MPRITRKSLRRYFRRGCASATWGPRRWAAVGCGAAARLGGLSWRESGCVAALMNTRGLMELIAVNKGRELGVIPDSVFGMLVIMALVTTLMTAPIVRRLLVGVRLEAGP